MPLFSAILFRNISVLSLFIAPASAAVAGNYNNVMINVTIPPTKDTDNVVIITFLFLGLIWIGSEASGSFLRRMTIPVMIRMKGMMKLSISFRTSRFRIMIPRAERRMMAPATLLK
jgi:hypothetical protein